MNNRTHITETEHKVIHHLKKRGEDKDTVLAIFSCCLKTDEDAKKYLDWLRAHPKANHDELFEYALTEFGKIEIPD